MSFRTKGKAESHSADSGTSKSNKFGGIRTSAYLEILIYLAVAVAVDYAFFGGNRFWSVSIHPFWPLIIIVSVQYGTSEGLLASFVATALLLIGKLPPQKISQDLYEYLFYVIRTPLMWFVASVLLGELRGRHKRETESLREDLESTKSQLVRINGAYQQAMQVKENLEVRMAGQLKTAVRIYEAARMLDKLDPQEVLKGVMDVVKVTLNPEKFSLFLLKDNELELVTAQSWNERDTYSWRFSGGNILFQEVIGRQRFLCSANEKDEELLGKEGILAGPLAGSETGDVVGMLKIERMGFIELNLSGVQTFKTLCQWIGTAYANALQYKIACADKVFDEGTSLFSNRFLARQTTFLTNLAQRVGFDLSMLILRIENLASITDEQYGALSSLVGRLAKSMLRITDMAFDCRQDQSEYCLLLPNTSLKNAWLVANRLMNRFQESLPQEFSQVSLLATPHVLYSHDQQKDDLKESLARANSNLLPASLFSWYIDYITALADRVGFSVSLITLQSSKMHGRQEEGKTVSRVVTAFARKTDLLFEPGEHETDFRVVMPKTMIDEAQEIAVLLTEKINQELQTEGIETLFSSKVSACTASRPYEALKHG
jgi:polysaccharide biosynthesis protein PelD